MKRGNNEGIGKEIEEGKGKGKRGKGEKDRERVRFKKTDQVETEWSSFLPKLRHQ